MRFPKLTVNSPSFNDQLTIKTLFSHTLDLQPQISLGDKIKYTAGKIITFL